mgnify:FL=1
MIAVELVRARGHPLVRASHRSTLEVTTDATLTPRGDCIVAVAADKSASQLSAGFKCLAAREGARIVVVLSCGGLKEVIRASGSPSLRFTDPRSMVVRRSGFVDGRTVAVRSDKAAADIDRELVRCLQRGAELRILLVAYAPEAEADALRLLRVLPI